MGVVLSSYDRGVLSMVPSKKIDQVGRCDAVSWIIGDQYYLVRRLIMLSK